MGVQPSVEPPKSDKRLWLICLIGLGVIYAISFGGDLAVGHSEGSVAQRLVLATLLAPFEVIFIF